MKKYIIISIVVCIVIAGGVFTELTQEDSAQPDYPKFVTENIVKESFDLWRTYYLAHQTSSGTFDYNYNFITQELEDDDNQVRQAWALWWLVILHKEKPTDETREAIERGLDFWLDHTVEIWDVAYIVYPNTNEWSAGTVALLSLALIDYLRVEKSPSIQKIYKPYLDGYLVFLQSLQREDRLFSNRYIHENGEWIGAASPYSDGEILLAFAKAAKYLWYRWLRDWLVETAEKMYEVYVADFVGQWETNDTLKWFYQWWSMAFYEMYDAGWVDDRFAERIVDMAVWILDVHNVLYKTRNVSYALEWLAVAFETARRLDDVSAAEKIWQGLDLWLYKLMSWQIWNTISLEYNPFIKDNFVLEDWYGLGGVLNAKDEPWIRIDVLQHQMHATYLAKQFVYFYDDVDY